MVRLIINRVKKYLTLKKLIVVAVIVLVSAVAYGFFLFNKPHQGIAGKEASYSLPSKQLFDEFDQNENAANKKYLGKVISVYGKVSDNAVDSKGMPSLILEGGEMAGVGCQFDERFVEGIRELKKGQVIKIKGVCTGMLMDVVLVDCVPEESE